MLPAALPAVLPAHWLWPSPPTCWQALQVPARGEHGPGGGAHRGPHPRIQRRQAVPERRCATAWLRLCRGRLVLGKQQLPAAGWCVASAAGIVRHVFKRHTPSARPPLSDLVIERGERVAIIGPNGGCCAVCRAPAVAAQQRIHTHGCCAKVQRVVSCRQLKQACASLVPVPLPLSCTGAGKSTLLRLLMGREKPQEGEGELRRWPGLQQERHSAFVPCKNGGICGSTHDRTASARPPTSPPAVELGQYGITPNYFEQNQAQALDPRLTVLETLVRCGVQDIIVVAWPAGGGICCIDESV